MIASSLTIDRWTVEAVWFLEVNKSRDLVPDEYRRVLKPRSRHNCRRNTVHQLRQRLAVRGSATKPNRSSLERINPITTRKSWRRSWSCQGQLDAERCLPDNVFSYTKVMFRLRIYYMRTKGTGCTHTRVLGR